LGTLLSAILCLHSGHAVTTSFRSFVVLIESSYCHLRRTLIAGRASNGPASMILHLGRIRIRPKTEIVAGQRTYPRTSPRYSPTAPGNPYRTNLNESSTDAYRCSICS
jgi:hypothetical protein